jgi:hypothetical protein
VVGVDDAEHEHEDQFAESDALIDEALATGEGESTPSTRPIDKVRRSAAGTVVAAGMFGLRDALEGRPEKDEPAIVVDAPTSQPQGPVEVLLDFEHPERSKVVIRRPPPDPPPE